MVAQHTNTPGEPPRALSEPVQRQLELAMRAFAANDQRSADLLRDAVVAAANEGRARELRSEELVIALRTIEGRVGELASLQERTRSEFRVRLMRSMLEAYYRS